MGMSKHLPYGDSFTLSFVTHSGSVAKLWIVCTPLVEGLRKEPVGCFKCL